MENKILMNISKAPDAHLPVCVLRKHPRFGTIEADCILTRLNLAAIYAATGTLLPEERTGMTGEEISAELVRRSWTNVPLDVTQAQMLKCVADCGFRFPTLHLVCAEVAQSASRLSFLFPKSAPNPFLNFFGEKS